MGKASTKLRELGSAILAGISIGIAATVYLKVGGLAGATLFGVGLLAVISLGFNLFTGKAQFALFPNKWLWLGTMLIFNLVGTWLVTLITTTPELSEASQSILNVRLNQGWWRCFLLAIPCGFIMTAAVRSAKVGNFWVTLLGVPTFIMCGFPHCIADSAYMWWAYNPWDFICLCYIPEVLGNFLGCNLYRINIKENIEAQNTSK